jgi:hypothetical protein
VTDRDAKGFRVSDQFPAATAGPATRRAVALLATAVHPGLAGRLAPLRRTEVRILDSPAVQPTLVAVLGSAPQVGVTTLAALVAQGLSALAPGRVAALDGDGRTRALTARLGAAGPAGLRQMLASPQVWRSRRAIDRYLLPGRGVPVLAAAAMERGWPLHPVELDTALHLLARRYPIVVADLPAHSAPAAARTADTVIIAGHPGAAALHRAYQWLTADRPGRDPDSVVTVGPQPRTRRSKGLLADIGVPADPALAGRGPVGLASLRPVTLAAVEAILCRVTARWREPLPAERRLRLSEGRG